MKTINPAARAGANRVLNIKALAGVDVQNPIEKPSETQLETLAARAVAQRFRITIHHARVVCELAGIGGAA